VALSSAATSLYSRLPIPDCLRLTQPATILARLAYPSNASSHRDSTVQSPTSESLAGIQAAAQTCEELKSWLLDEAFTRWWAQGADQERGGFHERLRLDGTPLDEPRRARVNPRQVYCYSLAEDLGWTGPAQRAVQHGIDYFLEHYRRPDRLFRGLVNADGTAVTERAVLYDQAFALLGLASAYETSSGDEYRRMARELHDVLRTQLRHSQAGFEESQPHILPLISNSHMHLLEASLEWMDLDHEPLWTVLAEEIVNLALTRFIDPSSGFVLEFFDREWRPSAGPEGRAVDPGHQYEWAWLLSRWAARNPEAAAASQAQQAALKLVSLTEQHGVDRERGVVVNALLTDKTVRDPQARLWPQTERIKAACTMAELTGEAGYWTAANDAARVLMKYLNTPLPGLWYDKMTVEGAFIDEPAPASSFYHIVCAIAELEHATKRAGTRSA
jgi:mannose/cellobiose epimerase-like protein (N-acyl-D-glucosamine 2-epimerase family)